MKVQNLPCKTKIKNPYKNKTSMQNERRKIFWTTFELKNMHEKLDQRTK